MSPAKVSISVAMWVAALPKPEKLEAIQRAEKWAWWTALHAPDRDTRRAWGQAEQQIKGLFVAVMVGI